MHLWSRRLLKKPRETDTGIKRKCMSFTVEEFRDLVRLLEGRSDWRAELRRLVLTDELLSLPGQIVELRTYTERRFQELAATQAQTEAQLVTLSTRVTELTAAQVRTEAKVTDLIQAQATMTVQLTDLTQSVRTLTDWAGELKGTTTEIEYRTKARVYFGRLLRRPHVLSVDEVSSLLDDAIESGMLSEAGADDIALADIVIRGKHKQKGTDLYLLVEVSLGVGPNDVERAARRATLLAQLGTPVIPAVAGQRLTAEAAELARTKQVWQIMEGYALSPEPIPPSL